MISTVKLPFKKEGTAWVARTLWGVVTVRQIPVPQGMTWNPFSKEIGWGVFIGPERVGWIKELQDALNHAALVVTQRANKPRSPK